MFTSNSKLRKSGIFGFNLPPIKTCPGAGECRRYCYGCKGFYRMFPQAAAQAKRNLAATRSKYFVCRALDELRRRRARIVRWHPVGDVYSQAYLNKLVTLARLTPGKLHYLYTKSLHLDWSAWDALPNTRRIQSEGGKYDRRINPAGAVARIFRSKAELEAAGWWPGYDSDMAAAVGVRRIGLVKH